MALEELHTKLDLEPPDLRGQARLSDPEALGGAGEAALFRYSHELLKMSELHGRAA
jgi:hypothetical protein